ncbi:MAG: nitroreductase [Anaerolineales bacterium]|nr:nitroreductase [Anaerolineales bacterium]
MDTLTAIHTRCSIGKVKPDPLPRDLIEKLLAAGAQAPNHHAVRPWRFIVLTGAGRERLGGAMAQELHERKPDTPAEGLQAERAKALRAPVLIAVAADKPAEAKVVEIENVCAAAAAAQNILLAAHALGLGAIWRTGPAATAAVVKHSLGLTPDQHLLGFIYVGYPLAEPAVPQRPNFADRTTWLE